MEPQIFFIRHPRYIKTKAEELVSFLLAKSGSGIATLCDDILDVARALCSSALQNSRYSRTMALIARATIVELRWRNVEIHATLQKELADLITSTFVVKWMEEFGRGYNLDMDTFPLPKLTLDDLETQLDQHRFKLSNPRLEESEYEDLYEEFDEATTVDSAVTIPSGGEEDYRFPEETLRSVNRAWCIMYVIDHLFLREDARCLHVLLNRATSRLAPSLELHFLQGCRQSIRMAATTMLSNAFPDVLDVFDLIDELISSESKSANTPNVARYAQRSCHRWDPTILEDVSFQA